MKWKITDDMLYGADYNPDQWLDRPDILKSDIELMKQANITVVALGMFSWSTIEATEGVFTFEWLDDILDNLHSAGIKVFLSTPSGARPSWLAHKYPEVLRTSENGQRNIYGERHNHCYSSPIYREKLHLINSKLAARYAKHPAVILWHLSNEYGGDCHCELCQEGFRDWLKDRYKTLDNLNRAWWSIFWSHKITDWNFIHSPVPHGDSTLHAKNLDWKRFITFKTIDFMKSEIKTLREVSTDIPTTTNMMQVADDPNTDFLLDYWKFRDEIDVSSWDSYPAWHLPGFQFIPDSIEDIPVDDYRRASEVAFNHDLFRSIGNGHFLLMESTPTNVNWQKISKLKKPGMNILTSLQAIAHGSNSVQYFQWRSSKGSSEKFHGTVVDHSGSNETRTFKESKKLGQILKDIKPLSKSEYKSEVALLFNWENRWAFENSQGPINTRQKAYLETIKKHYYALWDKGIQMDIVSGEDSLKGYKVLVAPMLHMVNKQMVKTIEKFVKNGGTLITTYQTGYVNETDLCFEGGAPGPLTEILGINIEQIDVLHQFESIKSIDCNTKKSATIKDYYEIVNLKTAKTLSTFSGGIADGKASVTINHYGKGEAMHIAGRMDVEDLGKFYNKLITSCDLSSNLEQIDSFTGLLNFQKRTDINNEYLFVMNFSSNSEEFKTASEYECLIDFNRGLKWEIKPYGIKILKK
ncbi:MAG: beta-galactosidase [Spirochaetaceae bacterium]